MHQNKMQKFVVRKLIQVTGKFKGCTLNGQQDMVYYTGDWIPLGIGN